MALAAAYVKPLIVAALFGLIGAHWLAPLDAATLSVAVLWVLVVVFT